ncbi:MAG: hypothetical protein KF781_01395 [Chitinophagaceae bacterium]|nr:hypothetical protein [Chitinophagaceae bacterium]MCW5905389.1 hypothetical protein [Chitinophagaceae bacterium]
MSKTGKRIFFLLSISIITAGLYLYNPYHLFFLADDFSHIPDSANNVWLQTNALRPVGNLSLHIDYLLSQQHALGYHVTNLLLHIINSFLVGVVVFHFFKKYTTIHSKWFAFITGIFFFVYPFHSEAIFWIIGRSGSLGTVFTLLSFYFFLQQNSWKNIIASCIFFQLALFSYESSWVFPIMVSLILLLNRKEEKTLSKKQIWYISIVWLLLFANILLRISATGELFNHYDAKAFLQFDFLLLAQNFLRLFARTWLPPMYHYQYMQIALLVVFVVMIVLLILLNKKQKLNHFFVTLTFIWLISYLPYLSIGIDTHGVEGERYLYLPSVFFCCWLLYILYNIFTRKIFVSIAFILMIMQLGFIWTARLFYEKAGNITKQTLHEMNMLSYKERIFVENLPQYNKGAVVFRVGLYSAIKWLYPKQNSEVIIVSKDDSDEKPKKNHVKDFTILYSEKSTPKIVSSLMLWNGKQLVQKDTTGILFSPNKDAWFSFSDSSLTIIR